MAINKKYILAFILCWSVHIATGLWDENAPRHYGQPCDHKCSFMNNLQCSNEVCNCIVISELRVTKSGEMTCEFDYSNSGNAARKCPEECPDGQFCNERNRCQCTGNSLMVSGEKRCADAVYEEPMKRCRILNEIAHVCDFKQHSYCKNRLCICYKGRYYNTTTNLCDLKKNSARYNGYTYKAIPGEYCAQKSDCIDGLYCQSSFTCSCPRNHYYNTTTKLCDLKKNSARYNGYTYKAIPGEYCAQKSDCIDGLSCQSNFTCSCPRNRYYNTKSNRCDLKKNSAPYNAIPEEYCAQKSDCIYGLSCQSNFTCSCPRTCVYKKDEGICDCGKVEFESPGAVLWTGGILGFLSGLFWLYCIRKTYKNRPIKTAEFSDTQDATPEPENAMMMSYHPHTEEFDESKGGIKEENESKPYPQNDQNVNSAYPPSMPTSYSPWKSDLGTPPQLPYPSSATPNSPSPPYSGFAQDLPEAPTFESTKNQLPYPTSVPPSVPSYVAPSESIASPPISSQPPYSSANVTTPYPVSLVGPGQVTSTDSTNLISPNSAANTPSLPETSVPSDPVSQHSLPSSNATSYPWAPPVIGPYPVTPAGSTNPYQPTAPSLGFMNTTPSGPYPT